MTINRFEIGQNIIDQQNTIQQVRGHIEQIVPPHSEVLYSNKWGRVNVQVLTSEKLIVSYDQKISGIDMSILTKAVYEKERINPRELSFTDSPLEDTLVSFSWVPSSTT